MARILKTMKSLIKIEESNLKKAQHQLNQAIDGEERLKKNIKTLHNEIAQEEKIAIQDNLMSQSFSTYIVHAKNQEQHLKSLLNDAETVTHTARDNLLKTHQEKKKYQRISEKKKQQIDRQIEKKEQQIVDELYQNKKINSLS